MARWIHEFRSTGERALTSEEKAQLVARARRFAVWRWLWGTLAVLAIAGSLLFGIAFAASGQGWGWALLVFGVTLGCFILGWASGAEKLALLHRCAVRLGTVEEFRRVRGDETSRRMWAINGLDEAKEEAVEEEEPVTPPANGYWRVDEMFEESLVRCAGGPVEAFTTAARDGAILWVEGRPIRKLLEPTLWEVVE